MGVPGRTGAPGPRGAPGGGLRPRGGVGGSGGGSSGRFQRMRAMSLGAAGVPRSRLSCSNMSLSRISPPLRFRRSRMSSASERLSLARVFLRDGSVYAWPSSALMFSRRRRMAGEWSCQSIQDPRYDATVGACCSVFGSNGRLLKLGLFVSLTKLSQTPSRLAWSISARDAVSRRSCGLSYLCRPALLGPSGGNGLTGSGNGLGGGLCARHICSSSAPWPMAVPGRMGIPGPRVGPGGGLRRAASRRSSLPPRRGPRVVPAGRRIG